MEDGVRGVTGQSAQQRVAKENTNEYVSVTVLFQIMVERNVLEMLVTLHLVIIPHVQVNKYIYIFNRNCNNKTVIIFKHILNSYA